MAALLHSNHRSAGRSNHDTSTHATISTSLPKLTLSTKSLRSASSLSQRNDRPSSMSACKASSPLANDYHNTDNNSISNSTKQSSSNHTKLHKRAGSGSLPGPPSPFVSGYQFPTPYATYEDEEPGSNNHVPTTSATTKLKPYLRKMPSAKEDQGTIDLNKSIAENERLAGLGIQDFASRSAADVSFGHASRRQTHTRTTSLGSQASNGSGTFRAGGQPFIHPATKLPRPYTTPGVSVASLVNDEYADESDDVVEDEFRLGPGFRSKRSMSITSTNPTPLSQSHTASDLGLISRCASQSNLSLMSRASSSSNTKGRPRRGTDHSDLPMSPQSSGRSSIDKAFSRVPGRRSEPDTQSRDEVIRMERQKFSAKEAKKENRHQKRLEEEEARKEAARQRKQSNASERGIKTSLKHTYTEDKIPAQKQRKASSTTMLGGAQQEDGDTSGILYARSYEDYRPAHAATLPRYGSTPGESEKTGHIQYTTTASEEHYGNWMRFSTWAQTRLLSCGGVRRN